MTHIEFFLLLGGVGLFLQGMTIMSSGLQNAAGENLQGILEGATKSKIRAVLVGILITICIQSSSATDVMVIGFVNSGFMTLYQAIGVIMGANIGTTITAQITAFSLGDYAPLILFIGAVLSIFMKKQFIKSVGQVIMGFGMLFQGITLMKQAIAPLAQMPEFAALLTSLTNPFLLVLFGIAFTALLQSSSSSIVIFQSFAAIGLLPYRSVVYLAIGAAVGSVTPNLLASLTTNRDGKRSALLNLCFNLFRAALLMTLIFVVPQILDFIQSLSPSDVARQVANTHTLFAIIAVVVILPFSDLIVKLTYKILPQLEEEIMAKEDKKLLYMEAAETVPPVLALKQSKAELVRLGEISLSNLERAVQYFFNPEADKEGEVVNKIEKTIDWLDAHIVDKLVQIGTRTDIVMTEHQADQIHRFTLISADIERIGDYAQNIVEYADTLRNSKVELSDQGRHDLMMLADFVVQEVTLCLEVFKTNDFEGLKQANEAEDAVDAQKLKLLDDHVKRMMKNECNPLAGIVVTDMANDLEKCADHALQVAYALSAYHDEDEFYRSQR
ncbi:MAG: Na/Pi cotransporter family protein [Firmicutes bacterium]|nr:Na/Pi cotransporter family protein [Bacillota bacterium]